MHNHFSVTLFFVIISDFDPDSLVVIWTEFVSILDLYRLERLQIMKRGRSNKIVVGI